MSRAATLCGILVLLLWAAPARADEPESKEEEVRPDRELAELFDTAALWEVGSNLERVRAARAALVERGEEGLRFVLGRLDTDRTLETRAIRAVVQGVGKEAALPLLLERLEDPRRNVRANAVDLLVALEAREAAERIAKMLEDKEVRRVAVQALGRLGGAKEAAALTPLLEDADLRLVVAAVTALGRIGGAEAVPSLTRLLGHASGTARYPAQWALEAIGAPAADALRKTLREGTGPARIHAVRALSALPADPKTEEVLLELLPVEDPALRGWIVRALTRCDSDPGRAALAALAETEADPFVRRALRGE